MRSRVSVDIHHATTAFIPCSVLNFTYRISQTCTFFSFECFNILGGDTGTGFAPTFVEKPKIIPNETGSLITMKCKCKANPKPVVTWYRGTNIVKESAKIKMIVVDKETDIYEMSLEIKVGLYHSLSQHLFITFIGFVVGSCRI